MIKSNRKVNDQEFQDSSNFTFRDDKNFYGKNYIEDFPDYDTIEAKEDSDSTNVEKDLIPPCGEVCELKTDPNFAGYDFNTINAAETALKGKPFITKEFDCPSIISRMTVDKGPKKGSKPPIYPPDHLIPAFTMFGRMPIRQKLRYFSNNTYDPEEMRVLLSTKLDKIRTNFQKGKNIGTYGYEVVDKLNGLLLKYREMNFFEKLSENGKAIDTLGLVIGSQRFWIEMLLLETGIKSLITLEYANILSEHPQIKIVYPHILAQEVLINLDPKEDNIKIHPMFDVAVSYSSLEHCGLGRYGEELNPFGDLEAMAQAWCLMKPGGLFFLNVPFTPSKLGYIEWNAHRVYNWERILHMASNWIILEYTDHDNDLDLISKIFVLQKPFKDGV